MKTTINKAKIAVIMTCFNRRETTLACLRALHQQTNTFDVFLTDDGSSDGTAEAIKAEFPQVNILQGNGNLFWVGGMRLAFGEAIKNSYNYYLWLNDDTFLETDTLDKLLNIQTCLSEQRCENSIIVGTTQDAITKNLHMEEQLNLKNGIPINLNF